MKWQKKSQVIMITALGIFVLSLILSIVGLSRTVKNINQEQASHTPEAILASAGVDDGTDVSLPVTYFDQRSDACINMYDQKTRSAADARQFEWTSCNYNNKQLEQGIVDYKLGEDYLPVAVGGELIPNRGLDNMKRWFTNVKDKSKEYAGSLKLVYRDKETTEFSFVNNDFYPLDTVNFSDGDKVNSDGHNHLFTMNFAIPFVVAASGEETLEITADDDTFVFVGDELVLDMGGIHDAIKGELMINEQGEVHAAVNNEEKAYSGTQVSGDSIVRIFHADRNSDESVFRIRLKGMNLNVMPTQLANGDDGVQVAYDPENPSFVKPLGESSTFRPDGTKGYVVMATVLGMTIVLASLFAAMLAHSLIRQKRR
ncbi:MAG: hypothetical protein K6G49_02550 [Candidatus Saccharibacteria bacterium]|nr:hypothetical protein [Candidatus Saccharibacteria bacterium]